MYITVPARDRNELWVADIDGGNKTKIAAGDSLATGFWSPDSSQLSFIEEKPGSPDKPYIAHADGSGLQLQLTWSGGTVQALQFSADQKTVYLNSLEKTANSVTVSKESADGSTPEKLSDTCGFAFAVAPGGKYLLTLRGGGAKVGVYQLSLADGTCSPLVTGVVTFGVVFAKDGKSFTYAVPSQHDVPIYRQGWQDGTRRQAPDRANAPIRVPAGQWRKRLRLFARPNHSSLRPRRRPRRPVSSEPKVKIHASSRLL